MNEPMNFSYDMTSYTGAGNFLTSASVLTPSTSSLISFGAGSVQNGSQVVNNLGRYSIYEIANWFLRKSDMTHKKLQKLCYYAQAWCYALHDYRLIDSDFQAWVHGPVSPALWERFKSFGYDTISLKGNPVFHILPDDEELLEDVWETYGDRTGNALEALSHREMPWLEARKGYAENERCSIVISPDIMKKYYKSIYSGD